MLENDLIITRFLDAYENTLSDEEVAALMALFELDDTVLLDLLLGRAEPAGDLNTMVVRDVLARMRTA